MSDNFELLLQCIRASAYQEIRLSIGTDGNVYLDDDTSKYPRLWYIVEQEEIVDDRSIPTATP